MTGLVEPLEFLEHKGVSHGVPPRMGEPFEFRVQKGARRRELLARGEQFESENTCEKLEGEFPGGLRRYILGITGAS